MIEKRVYPRFNVQLSAAYHIADQPTQFVDTKTINISQGGFCIVVSHNIAMGTQLRLIVELTAEESVLLDVVAVWIAPIERTDKYLLGVKIMDIDNSNLTKYKKYIIHKDFNRIRRYE